MKIVFIIDEAHIGSSQSAQAAKANKTILISTHEQELLSLPHSRIIKFNDKHTILN